MQVASFPLPAPYKLKPWLYGLLIINVALVKYVPPGIKSGCFAAIAALIAACNAAVFTVAVADGDAP